MKLGFAFRGLPGAGAAVPEILTHCRKNGLHPEGYVLSGDTLRGFLADYRGMPYTCRFSFFRRLTRQGILFLHHLSVPVLCCEYDLLRERSIYTGNTLCFPKNIPPCVRLKQLDRRLGHKGVYRVGKSYRYHGYLSVSQLFLGLTLLGCEQGILFELVPSSEPEQLLFPNPKQAICRIPLDLSCPVSGQISRWFDRYQTQLLCHISESQHI